MSNDRDPQYLQAIRLMEPFVSPFMTPDNEVYIKYNNGTFRENHPVESSELKRIIGSKFFTDTSRALDRDGYEKIKNHYSAMAYQRANREKVYIRTTYQNQKIYYDLANSEGQIIEIDADGWRIVTETEINFVRTKSMLPAVKPEEEGADLLLIREHLGIRNDDNFLLVLGFIMGALYKPPYTLLIHGGEQGTGKSTKSKMIAQIVDPSSTPLISKPNTERDVFIASSKTHLMSYDNLSGLKQWASDTFCILATGGGYRTRALYTNNEEQIFNVARPIQMNGIDDIATRGDLIDRSIILNHPVIPMSGRTTESRLWRNFNRDLPKIMGGLFNVLSIGLRNLPSTRLTEIPRMADFALFCCASAEALGTTAENFMRAYKENLDRANRNSLELNPVSNALFEFINDRGQNPNGHWTGTMSELRERLLYYIPDELHRSHFIPQTPQALSNALKRLSPMLRRQGIIHAELPRTSSSRRHEIYQINENANNDKSDDSDN